MLSCNHKVGITGHWRPVDSFHQEPNSIGHAPKFRDLILNKDSTFISKGFDHQTKQTEGWHNAITQKGRWSFSDDILSLVIEGVSYPAKFKVLKLTDKELVMESEFMEFIELKLIRIRN